MVLLEEISQCLQGALDSKGHMKMTIRRVDKTDLRNDPSPTKVWVGVIMKWEGTVQIF